MAYWRLFYHLVWSTSERRPIMQGEVKGLVEGSIRTMCREHKILIHALGIQSEHVHLAASIPPSVAISTFVGRTKGSTSHLVNQVAPLKDERFAWQDEYGVFSFGEKVLPEVVAYVDNQEERHRTQRLWEALERTSEDASRLQPASFGQRGV